MAFLSCIDDCDDSDSTAYPGAASLEPTLCTIDADGDGYGDVLPSGVAGDCLLLALVDTGRYWDAASVTITADGVEIGSYYNTNASAAFAEEEFLVCGLSGSTVVASYSCTSSYDCANQSMSIYLDNDGDGSYDDSVGSMTGYNTAQDDFYTGSISTIDAGTDCDDSDPSIGPSSTGVCN